MKKPSSAPGPPGPATPPAASAPPAPTAPAAPPAPSGLPAPLGAAAPPPPQAPFPLHCLPGPVQRYCKAVAEARSVDVSAPAAASIAAMASAIGNSRVAYDDFADWREPACVWFGYVAPSGSRKTPVQQDMFCAHKELQREFDSEYRHRLEQYEVLKSEWDQKKKSKKESATAGPPPEKPVAQVVATTDATPEALARLLGSNPRGVATFADELSGWFGRMGAYGSGGPAKDRSFWLSAHSGAPIRIDRATADPVTVERGLVTVFGGIQPSVLEGALDEEAMASGLGARFLLVYPEPSPKQYRKGPTPDQRAEYIEMLVGLFGMQMEQTKDRFSHQVLNPVDILFEEACRGLLAKFVPDWSAEGMAAGGWLAAAMSKLEAYALRFALLLRCAREAEGKCEAGSPILVADLEAGIELVRWFRVEAERTYRRLGLQSVDPDNELVSRIKLCISDLSGGITVREFQKVNTRKTSDECRAELQRFVDLGHGEWVKRPPGKNGGRPTEEVVPVAGGQRVSGCTPLAGDPQGEAHGALESSPKVGEVSGCGLRVAEANEAPPPPNAVKNGVPGEVSGCCEGVLQPETSSVDEEALEEHRAQLAEEACNPQPATRNPRDAASPDVLGAPSGVERGIEAIGGEEFESIPWHQIDGGTTEARACFNCKSQSFWRRRGTSTRKPGEWTCVGCCVPTIDEGLIERRDFQGGAA